MICLIKQSLNFNIRIINFKCIFVAFGCHMFHLKKKKTFERSPSYFTKYFYSELRRLVEDLGGIGSTNHGVHSANTLL